MDDLVRSLKALFPTVLVFVHVLKSTANNLEGLLRGKEMQITIFKSSQVDATLRHKTRQTLSSCILDR